MQPVRRPPASMLALVAVVGALTSRSAAPAVVTTHLCAYHIERSATSGRLRCELYDGVIHEINFDNFQQGMPGRPCYNCTVDAIHGDNQSKWSREGEKIEIHFAETPEHDGSDFMAIAPNGKGFLLDMSNTRPAYKCGAGAELPKYIALSTASKKCSVTLRKHP